jgi:hypothetical protein
MLQRTARAPAPAGQARAAGSAAARRPRAAARCVRPRMPCEGQGPPQHNGCGQWVWSVERPHPLCARTLNAWLCRLCGLPRHPQQCCTRSCSSHTRSSSGRHCACVHARVIITKRTQRTKRVYKYTHIHIPPDIRPVAGLGSVAGCRPQLLKHEGLGWPAGCARGTSRTPQASLPPHAHAHAHAHAVALAHARARHTHAHTHTHSLDWTGLACGVGAVASPPAYKWPRSFPSCLPQALRRGAPGRR